ncbi:MAG: TRAP transporter large permease subunit [Deltaproteobacteria bacterium]|nr:TRAP transporter large permease subunit [Deltaproteobacteria bacterium]
MEWWLMFSILVGALLIMMATGLPVAFCFLIINLVGAVVLWGGEAGLQNLVTSMYRSVTNFSLLPLALFIFMGEVLAHSGMALRMIDCLDKWMGKVRARLSLLAIAGGVVIGALSGSTPGAAAILGEVLAPEMMKRGYKEQMVIGPIIGSAGLAVIIPPSGLCVFLATLSNISVGSLLIAGIIPGMIMAAAYATYIIGRCRIDPSLAPSYSAVKIPLGARILELIRNVLPLGIIIFVVTGFILLGFTTPTEAGAWGAAASFILAAIYGGVNREMIRKSFAGTLNISVMMFMIFLGASAYSQIMAYSGATGSMVRFATSVPVSPIFIIVITQLVVLFLGMFMGQTAIMMITLPIFMPIVKALGFSDIWFGMIMLINLEIANRTPPFGFLLFAMKGVLPGDTKMSAIYKAAIPYIICDLLVLTLIFIFPSLAVWLPKVIR